MNKPFLITLIILLPLLGAAENIQQFDLNARDVALGTADLTDGSWSLNPAGLEAGSQTRLELSQARLGYDRYGYQLTAAFHTPLGLFGLGLDQLIIQNEPYERLLFDSRGVPIIDPTTNEQAFERAYELRIDSGFNLGYGLMLSDHLMVGLKGQVFHLKVGEDYAWGVDANVGMIAGLTPRWHLAVVLLHLNRQWLAWHNPYRENLGKALVNVGASYDWAEMRTMIYLTQSQTVEDASFGQGQVGLAYYGLKPLTIRMGWSGDALTVGVGLSWNQVSLDYGADTQASLDTANRVTVGLGF